MIRSGGLVIRVAPPPQKMTISGERCSHAGADSKRPVAGAPDAKTGQLNAMRSIQAPGVLNRSPSGTPHAAHAAHPLRGVCLLCLEHMRHKEHMCFLCLCLELCLENPTTLGTLKVSDPTSR